MLVGPLFIPAYAFSTGMAASLVIGQADFNSSSPVTTQTGLYIPGSSAFDAAGNLWVADSYNNRVLMFKPPFSNGMAASLVIGQGDFTHNVPNTNATRLNSPGGIAFDAAGDLWIADSDINRVLMFKPPFATGMAASAVIGQPLFTDWAPGTSQTTLYDPLGLGFDASGNLWVADQGNGRVLMFKPPFTNGKAASLVIGQPDYVTGGGFTSQTRLNGPVGVGFDASGNLWVADLFSNRVVLFKPPFSNGMAASLVIGQEDFTHYGSTYNQTRLNAPRALGFDASGNLWVSDFRNNRVLRFAPPFSTGMAASLVIGQPDFVHSVSVASQTGLYQPAGLVFDAVGNIWVTDSYNSRVLMFASSSGLSSFLLELQAGWNLISLPVVPSQTAIAKLLAPLIQWHDLSIVWGFTPAPSPGAWSFFKPGPPSSGTLTSVVDGKAYWIYVTDAFKMTVVGYVVPPGLTPPSYLLVAGWNLIGFKPQPNVANETIATYLTSISGKYTLVLVYDNLNETWLQGAGDLQLAPGEGMWLFMKTPATLLPQ